MNRGGFKTVWAGVRSGTSQHFHKIIESGKRGMGQGVRMLQPSTRVGISPAPDWEKQMVGLDGRIAPLPEGFSSFFSPFWMILEDATPSHGKRKILRLRRGN